MLNALFGGKVEDLWLCRMLSMEPADEPLAGYASSLAAKLRVLSGWCLKKFLSRGKKELNVSFQGDWRRH